TNLGLLVFDGDSIRFMKGEMPVDGLNIKKVISNPDGSVLILTRDALLRWDNQLTTLYSAEGTSVFFDAEMDHDGRIWIACKDPGLIMIDGARVATFGVLDGLVSSSMADVMVDSNNHVWVSSIHGISRLTDSRIVNYSSLSGLPVDDIRTTFEDDEGNIWIGSQGAGLIKFVGDHFETLTVNDGLCSNAIMSVTQDTTGAYWFASYDNGICQMVNGRIIPHDLDAFTGNNKRFWTSVCDAAGDLWFGSSNNLVRYGNGEFESFDESAGLPGAKILCLHQGLDSTLWIGTTTGLAIHQASNPGIFTELAELSGVRVRGIAGDAEGNTWLATKNGVWHFDGTTWINYTVDHGLPDNSTYCVGIDGLGRAWVGTGQGLAFWEDGHWQRTNPGADEGSSAINFIQRVDDDMWVGTNNGIYRTHISRLTHSNAFRWDHYTTDDGLMGRETNLNAVFLDHRNAMWFGTTAGVVKVDMNHGVRSPDNIKPRLYVTHLAINLKEPDWKNLGFDAKPVGAPSEVEVSHKGNHFTFYFDGISLTYPDDVHYQFMLEGFDKDWQPITTANFANYANLPFESFVFRVRAVGKGGTMSDPVAIAINIRPPFWRSWWFMVLCALSAIGLVALIYQRRKKELITRLEKEKFEYRSKMLLLEQQTLNSSMNRHFIFNALNSIQYYINRQDRLAANKYLSAFAKLIRKNLDSSQVNLTSLRDEVERLELYLGLEHMRFQDKFSYRIDVDEDVDVDGLKVPAMLLQPFLENSIWHGILPKEEPGEIRIHISRSNGSLEFTITDNGIGIETSLKNKQVSGSHISQGMSITSGRIDLLNKMSGERVELLGPYEIRGEEGLVKGTEVKIILPVNFHEIYVN
ncbi:MAG: histidine kinase, partial [Flavobacteriales bacterium]|nr:histidine kinase [Flavobacteriales bacterium]